MTISKDTVGTTMDGESIEARLSLPVSSFLTFIVIVGLLLLPARIAHGQARFVSSSVDLEYAIQVDGESRSDLVDPVSNEFRFMREIGDGIINADGSGDASAAVDFDFTSSLIEANGHAAVDVSGDASAAAGVTWELSFDISRLAFYAADFDVLADLLGSNGGLGLFYFDGTEVFSQETQVRNGAFGIVRGVLGPDGYTLRANVSADAFSMLGNVPDSDDAEFRLSLELTQPELPLVFRCQPSAFDPAGICLDAIFPAINFSGRLSLSESEQFPFSLDGVDLSISRNEMYDFGDGEVIADLTVFDSQFDGDNDNFPENLYDFGTRVLATLAFEPGSLSGNESLEKIPVASFLGGQVQLIGPNGDILATTRLRLIPEPSALTLMTVAVIAGLCKVNGRAASLKSKHQF